MTQKLWRKIDVVDDVVSRKKKIDKKGTKRNLRNHR